MSLAGSLFNLGAVTAPAAGAAIVSIPNVPPGVYHVEVAAYLSAAAPGAGDADNIRLQVPAVGGGQQNGPALPLEPVQNAPTPLIEVGRIQIAAVGTVSVNAVGAGTASVIYHVLLVLDPVLN